MATMTYTGTLTIIECYKCHITFAMPKDLDQRALADDSISFYCPLGHPQGYVDTELKRLRREKERLQQSLTSKQAYLDQVQAERDHQERRVRGYQGALAKTKKRAARGVCPVPGCKRHFADVERHIASKHPEWQHGEAT